MVEGNIILDPIAEERKEMRKYFAGLAMQGQLSKGSNSVVGSSYNELSIARNSVSLADALIKELEKKHE